MKSISVIVPSYNRAQLLSRCLGSIISQKYAPAEIIVIDDGSSDGTKKLISQDYPRIKLISQKNGGVSAARNSGIRAAKGDWLAFLDSDDTWSPDKLERQVRELEKSPGHHFVHANELWIRNGTRVNQRRKHKKYGGSIFKYCLPLCVISPSSAVIHKQVFDQVGLFDESMPVCEDYDMWLRVCARMPVLFVDEPLIAKYGGHADQLSNRYWGMDRYRIRAIDKILNEAALRAPDRQAAVNVLLSKIRIYLNGAKKRDNLVFVPECEKILAQYAD